MLRIIVSFFEIIASVFEAIFATIAGLLAVVRVRAHQKWEYKRWLTRDLADCDSILELGCGSNSPILQIGYGKKTTALDIFEPYVKMHNSKGDYKIVYLQDILKYKFPDKAFDAVVITDVMEHLEHKTVYEIKLIENMCRCARKRVIMFTPNGYVENDEVDGNPYQAHVKDGWEPADWRKQGFKVVGATGLRYILGKASLPKYHPYSVFAIIAMLSQPFIFNRPELAWHSYAVKEIKEG